MRDQVKYGLIWSYLCTTLHDSMALSWVKALQVQGQRIASSRATGEIWVMIVMSDSLHMHVTLLCWDAHSTLAGEVVSYMVGDKSSVDTQHCKLNGCHGLFRKPFYCRQSKQIQGTVWSINMTYAVVKQ